MSSLLVTGAAGFIGSAFVREALNQGAKIIMYDALTYAGHLPNVEACLRPGVCEFIKGDIRDYEAVLNILRTHAVAKVVNFAAESHVDNSILGPKPFFETNVMGTFALLEAARTYWQALTPAKQVDFRFVHISTDEVYGELGDEGQFTETSPYQPNSPYSASKAASDHAVHAWGRTYKLPVVTTHCSNNYGPRQYPEKLIPRMITCALSGKPLPVYAKGANVRDWIHVEDHVRGIWLAMTRGQIGETYCFGGHSERRNLQVVESICSVLDKLKPRPNGASFTQLITFVADRASHDWRYAIDDQKAMRELGFGHNYANFEDGLRQTVEWYLNNEAWIKSVMEKTR